VYDRPQAPADVPAGPSGELPASTDLRRDLLDLLSCPNVGSKRWIWRQYDQIVRGGTLVAPGADAAVVRVLCARDATGTLRGGETTADPVEKLLAFSVDCNGRFVELDPYQGAAIAAAETCRNLVCSGAEPLGMTDCLNFGNPERPEVMRQFAQAIDGLSAACQALGVPIVSGNVSLYNETNGRAILPTPTVATVGLVRSVDEVVTPWWKEPGDVVFLLGEDGALGAGLAGSEYADQKLPALAPRPAWPAGAEAPTIDLAAEVRLQRLLLDLIRDRKLRSAHDVSDGGLAVALAECATTGRDGVPAVGARIDLVLRHDVAVESLDLASTLFGEHPSRVVVSVRPTDTGQLLAAAESAKVGARELGVTGGATLSIHVGRAHARTLDPSTKSIVATVEELREARERALVAIVGM